MILLSVIVNAADFISTDKNLGDTLTMIYQNQGTIPTNRTVPRRALQHGNALFHKIFLLRYKDDGTLVMSNMENIAAVTEDDIGEYLDIAVRHGEGFGYTSGYNYKYYIVKNGDDKNMVIFLDCQNEMRSVKTILWLSAAATVFALPSHIWVLCFFQKSRRPGGQGKRAAKAIYNRRKPRAQNAHNRYKHLADRARNGCGQAKWIDKALYQTDKLKKLVDSLVSLAKADEGGQPVMSDFDISSAAREAVDSFLRFCGRAGSQNKRRH